MAVVVVAAAAAVVKEMWHLHKYPHSQSSAVKIAHWP